jgi:hypothetical protein
LASIGNVRRANDFNGEVIATGRGGVHDRHFAPIDADSVNRPIPPLAES